MPHSPESLSGRSIVIQMAGVLCTQPAQIFQSPHAVDFMQRFINQLQRRNSPWMSLFTGMQTQGVPGDVSEAALSLTRVLGLLVDLSPEDIGIKAPDVAPLVKDPEALCKFVQQLYDRWRSYERYLIFEGGADQSRDRALEGHVSFIHSIQDLNHLVLDAFQRIQRNLRGHWPRVYRQVPAGANMSLLVDTIRWPCPGGAYSVLEDVRMVRLALTTSPVVLYPQSNKRQGTFERVEYNPLERVVIDSAAWMCLPIQVGKLSMLLFFHRDFLAHAVCLLNLFELSGHNEARERPDAILVFGVPQGALPDNQTVFYEDEDNDLVLGVIGRSAEVDYLGYFKKMLLTMHNVVMMRRGRLPVHGAMARIVLSDGASCNLVIVGDSGAGKSETLEAFRTLADEHLSALTTIFDDMGSLDLSIEGQLTAYGTEIGAFVRLDDLDPGFAFGRIDSSIFINPHRQNARVVLPVSDYSDVVAGYSTDMLLYANNYEPVDEKHPIIEFFSTPEAALDVFRQGYRAAKGTSDETGLVQTYFGNPFGPVQLHDLHEQIADRFFERAFEYGVPVGQLRTRLGVEGYDREGPEQAAMALMEHIRRSAGTVQQDDGQ